MRHLPQNDVDPIVGNHGDPKGGFSFPHAGSEHRVEGFSKFVTTRGAAYLFYPSLSTLRKIKAGQGPYSPSYIGIVASLPLVLLLSVGQ